MTTTGRRQQRYDHRLRDLVQGTGDVTIATDLGVPRSTARGWLGKALKVVVRLDVTDLRASELQQEVLELRRRVRKLTALLRLALALLRSSGFTLTHERLPDGRAKIRILRAVDRARAFVPLRAVLRFLRLSPSRFHAWRRLQNACALDDQSSCPHTSPHRLTPPEVRAIKHMLTALEYRHVPIRTLAVLAQRLGTVWAFLALLKRPFSLQQVMLRRTMDTMRTAQRVIDPAQVSSITQQLSRENTPDSPVGQKLRRQVANRSSCTPTTSTITGRHSVRCSVICTSCSIGLRRTCYQHSTNSQSASA